MSWQTRPGPRGFTLVELMITVAILGIVAAIAIPTYKSQVQKARRSDAQQYLSETLVRQEDFYARNRHYTDNATGIGYDTADLLTPEEHYRIGFNACGAGLTECVEITANAGGSGTTGTQTDDRQGGVDCSTLILNSSGNRTPIACW